MTGEPEGALIAAAARDDESCRSQARLRIMEAVREYLGPAPDLRAIADFGCGIGAMAPLLFDLAATMVGIEASSAMAAQALELRQNGRSVYTSVVASEPVAYLNANAAAFDLVVAAEALCAYGDLTETLDSIGTALRPRGLVAFTLVCADEGTGPSFVADAQNGYRHSETYVRTALRQAGLAAKLVHPVAVGAQGTAVNRLLVLAKKPR